MYDIGYKWIDCVFYTKIRDSKIDNDASGLSTYVMIFTFRPPVDNVISSHCRLDESFLSTVKEQCVVIY